MGSPSVPWSTFMVPFFLFIFFCRKVGSFQVPTWAPEHHVGAGTKCWARTTSIYPPDDEKDNVDFYCPSVYRSVRLELAEVTQAMLFGSDFIYALSTLRKRGDKVVKALGFEALNEYELIRTDRYGGIVKHPNRRLKYPITVAAIRRFVQLNPAWIHELSGVNSDPSSPNSIEAVLNVAIEDNIELIELDDLRQTAAPAFGITINRTRKRITVVFRGTNNDHDIATDLKLYLSRVVAPDKVKAISGHEYFRIHHGFRSYLGLSDINNVASVCSHIIDILEDLMMEENFREYQLFVSGHSLGGALAQIFAYMVAGGTRLDKYPMVFPVTCLSFASPPVGDLVYHKSFAALEEKGWLRHIRFSNQGDPVPVTLPWFEQSGLRVHYLKRGNATQIDYNTNDRFIGQFLNMWHFQREFPWVNPIYYHGMDIYMDNTDDRSKNLFKDMTLEAFWDQYVGRKS